MTTKQMIRTLFRSLPPGKRLSMAQVRDALHEMYQVTVIDGTIRDALIKMSAGNVPELVRVHGATRWGGNAYYLSEHPEVSHDIP